MSEICRNTGLNTIKNFKFIFLYSLNDLMQIIIPVIIHNEKNTTGINVSFAIKLINHPSLPLIILWWKRVYVKTIKKPISPNPRKLSPKINFLILFISPSLFGIFTICSIFYSLLICSAMRSNAVKTTSVPTSLTLYLNPYSLMAISA